MLDENPSKLDLFRALKEFLDGEIDSDLVNLSFQKSGQFTNFIGSWEQIPPTTFFVFRKNTILAADFARLVQRPIVRGSPSEFLQFKKDLVYKHKGIYLFFC